MRRDGEQFRIVATLTDDSGSRVWARGFDLDANMSGIFPDTVYRSVRAYRSARESVKPYNSKDLKSALWG